MSKLLNSEPLKYEPSRATAEMFFGSKIKKETETSIGLFEFAKQTIKELEQIKDGNFADAFVKAKIFCFHNYQNGLVTSNSHGLSFFENVVKYWDDPDSYYTPLDKNNNIVPVNKRDALTQDYEYNFIKILKLNK